MDEPGERRPLDLSCQPPFALDVWRVEPARLSLSRPGMEQRLEPRVMGLLVTFAHAGSEVVSRAELLKAVWPDVVVGDEALTMAVSKLRRALGERARGGAFVETIPRVGYRLLAGVRADDEARREADAAAPPSPIAEAAGPEVDWRWLAVLPVAALALAGTVYIARPSAPAPSAPAVPPPESIGLTASPGLESQASLDPTGRRLVFRQDADGRSGLAVLDLRTNVTTQIVDGPSHSPAWSPIDQRIAFISSRRDRSILSVMAAAGGPIEELHEVRASPLVGIGWSPDARYLAVASYAPEAGAFAIEEIELDTGLVRRLTSPPERSLGDGRPAYSPDGRFIAFTRGRDLYSYDLYLLERDTLEVRRLTDDGRRVWGLDWLSDSSALVFSSNRSGPFQLWLLPVAVGAEPVWIPAAGDQVRLPSVRGTTLVYDAFEVPADLFEIKADGSRPALLAAISSKGRESAPAWSPDGSALAYASDRSGTAEVWVLEEDRSPRRVSRLGASMIYSIAWSPDASEVVAVVILEGRKAVCTVEVRTGESRVLADPGGTVLQGPVFAPDGRSVFLASNVSGRFEIWSVGLERDAEPSRLTDFGAFAVRFGSDGTPYVLPSGRAELLRRDPSGDWRTVLSDFRPRRAFAWTVRGDAVHALHLATDGALVWQRWPLGGDPAESLGRVPPRLENGGFAVHPDGLSAVFGRLLPMESDLRMITLPPPVSNPGPRPAARARSVT